MSEDIQFYCARLLEIETELSELLPTLEDDRGSMPWPPYGWR